MMLGRLITRPIPHPQNFDHLFRTNWPASMANVRFASTKSSGDDKKSPARRPEVQRLLYQAEERYKAAGGGVEPIPKITLEHVSIGYARSGGSGGQSFNKVNTRVDMRFNVKNALWLNEKVRERIMQMEKNRINKDGEIVITSSKTRTQQGNAEDAMAKLQVFNYQKKKLQAIIDAASYVPPPPSEETMKKITEL
ncbi:peptidyl-tRNA hydrolase ict1 mitochondrial [Phtheirospermum japonicum]|uniref:Peptidyl-tRNA hydrolase ict1 mitochondrial n=1 Tax=Phtheirospermum japonicum TaxID=374723 RepID=A0A830CWU3_9LAMI|nr:peptidyl-tRNA hydrolase ict1 mitochondrial [Phtheirospermum japonicum]